MGLAIWGVLDLAGNAVLQRLVELCSSKGASRTRSALRSSGLRRRSAERKEGMGTGDGDRRQRWDEGQGQTSERGFE